MTALPLIALQQLSRIGAKTTLSVADEAPCDPEAFYGFVQSRFNRSHSETARAWNRAQQIVEHCEQLGIHPIAVSDFGTYPRRLHDIGKDKPPVLYVKGSLDALRCNSTVVAIIGTREPTEHGKTDARRLGRLAARHNVPVVSGLAYGCDFYGHNGCLAYNGTAIAVLAHGLDTVYPPEHEDLANRIVAADGCLLSEYPPGSKATKWTFIERDRLQSALAEIVIVVQTGIRGGTMHTVRFAEKQKKLVACMVPNQIDLNYTKVQGNLDLIRKGRGIGIKCAEDMLSLLNYQTTERNVVRHQSQQGVFDFLTGRD